MRISNAALLGAFLVIGIIGSVSDIKTGRIHNRLFFIGISIALVVHAIDFVINPNFYFQGWLVIIGLSGFIAILMFFGELWAAGDTKFYILLLFCIPPQIIETDSLSVSVVPYIYIFLLAVIWILIDTLWKTINKMERFSDERSISMKTVTELIKVYIEISAIQALFVVLFPSFCHENELLFSVGLIAVSFIISSASVFGKWIVVSIHALIILLLLLTRLWTWSFAPWWTYLCVVLIILFNKWASKYNYMRIPTSTVAEGMILSSLTVLSFLPSKIMGLPSNASESMSSKLSAEQAEAVRRWEKSAYGATTVVILRKIPFSLFIFIGMLLWMIIRVVR